MEKTTNIGLRPKAFEGSCGTCSTSCLSEAGQLLDKFDSFYVKNNNEEILFSRLDYMTGNPGWDKVSFNIFHTSPTYEFEKLYDLDSQRMLVNRHYPSFGSYMPPWCRFGTGAEDDYGRDLRISETSIFSTYDSYGLGVHCGDLTVQDSGSQFDVRTHDWGQDGIPGTRTLIDHNIFYLLLKTTCENKGFSANTSNHPHVVSTPSIYGSLTDRNSYIQKEKISANLSRKTFMYKLGAIYKWLTCEGCDTEYDRFGFNKYCPTQVEKYTINDQLSPVQATRYGGQFKGYDTYQEALDEITQPANHIDPLGGGAGPQPARRPLQAVSWGGTGLGGFYGGPGSARIACKSSQLQTWGWVDGGSYYEQYGTAAAWEAGCTGPVGIYGDQPDPTLFKCGTRKWQPYGYIVPSSPLPPIQGYTPPPPYLGCRSQKGHLLSTNGLVDTDLNQFTLSTPNDSLDLSQCKVYMASLLQAPAIQTRGADLVGMAFYSAPISDAATDKSHDFNFQEIYKREFSWKNINPTMEPFGVDITASI
jgi:hypothetical protein|tara:strand:+ start:6556 stop:8148 length:1593 start_codon:yes stop_codon:yes gene_type:complete